MSHRPQPAAWRATPSPGLGGRKSLSQTGLQPTSLHMLLNARQAGKFSPDRTGQGLTPPTNLSQQPALPPGQDIVPRSSPQREGLPGTGGRKEEGLVVVDVYVTSPICLLAWWDRETTDRTTTHHPLQEGGTFPLPVPTHLGPRQGPPAMGKGLGPHLPALLLQWQTADQCHLYLPTPPPAWGGLGRHSQPAGLRQAQTSYSDEPDRPHFSLLPRDSVPNSPCLPHNSSWEEDEMRQ